MVKIPKKKSPRKKIAKKVENSAFFAPFFDKIDFYCISRRIPMKIFPPPPPCDSVVLRVFCVFAVFFAAILGTTAANAQEARPARAQVYSTPDHILSLGGNMISLSAPVTDIAAFIVGNANLNALANYVNRVNPNDSQTAPDDTLVNGLPAFNGAAMGEGLRIEIRDQFVPAPGGGFEVFVVTLRSYRNAAGDLALADGEEPAGRTVAATDLASTGEFFLLTTGGAWMETTDAVDGTQGYVPAMAASAADDNGGGNPGGGDSNARDLAVIGLGVGVVGFMAAYLSGGDFSLFNFAPNVGYSATESGYAYNVGGRLNFRKDNWHLYAAAGQANSNGEFGDFRYESGGEYSADLWTAAFSETVQGETADYDFSLSADYHGGIWRLSPTYRLHSHLTEAESETDNALNLEGVLRYNRWTISPSAGFRWESADEFGDNARFNLSAVRRF